MVLALRVGETGKDVRVEYSYEFRVSETDWIDGVSTR